MADAEEKARQEKIAAAKKRVEQRKKKKDKKAAEPAKDDAKEETTEATEEAAPDATSDDAEKEKDSAIEEKPDDSKADEPESASPPSLAEQSKARSTSFRASSMSGKPTSPGPLSPDGDTAPDIYRKHVARIEELEKENKRLQKESSDSEKRWKKAEDELADLREADDKKGSDETEKLVRRAKSLHWSARTHSFSNRYHEALATRIGRPFPRSRHPPAFQAELDSKIATIESMEIEISKMRSQLERHQSGASSEKEQVAALEDKVARAEAAAGKAQRELQDVKKNLERATEKAVREGSERSSAETKASSLEHELKTLKATHEELVKKADGFEKKVTLTTLHKEQDSRTQILKREKDKAEADLAELRTRAEKLESENTKLRSRKSTDGGGGLDDEGMDELENEERQRLEKKIRSLEKEVHELRSGEWIQRRRDMEPSSFQDVDLSAPYGSPAQRKNSTSGIGQFFTNGLNALAGGGDDEGLLEDDDMEFDEEAFRKAHEEEQMRRLERIKELKRALKHWGGLEAGHCGPAPGRRPRRR
ncbi:hypothetical protein NLG97_g6276 [Lecanicillium saksenae]|uniref:Uncharacterized protein n=1 Tax=Lecanicillium saksenae TaxID=468837 RepID=A0ACC1QRY4_9HYPO|nr:hypothetical protein NLG97_g6276 [Lecanicillium saksenae]